MRTGLLIIPMLCAAGVLCAVTGAELSAASARRSQLWTDVAWTELEYVPADAELRSGAVLGVADEGEAAEDAEEVLGQYSYVCKCGYRYIVPEAQLDRLLDADDTEVDQVCVKCEWCSLGVRITADKR